MSQKIVLKMVFSDNYFRSVVDRGCFIITSVVKQIFQSRMSLLISFSVLLKIKSRETFPVQYHAVHRLWFVLRTFIVPSRAIYPSTFKCPRERHELEKLSNECICRQRIPIEVKILIENYEKKKHFFFPRKNLFPAQC